MPNAVTQQPAYQSGPLDDLSTGPAGEFAVETEGENGWHDSPVAAWASPPVSQFRLPSTLPIEFRPHGENPPDEFYRQRDAANRANESVTTLDADGFSTEVRLHPGENRFAPNPRSVPAVEARPTQRMSPSTWRFTRPFDQHSARLLNGQHFSMADHRRDYEVGGMAPVASRRNTFRVEPGPWDTDIVDVPPEVNNPSARLQSVEVPQTRQWRL